jgi:hypothetical protein
MCESWNTTSKLNNLGVDACSPITEENRTFNYHIDSIGFIRNCCDGSPLVHFGTAILDVLQLVSNRLLRKPVFSQERTKFLFFEEE